MKFEPEKAAALDSAMATFLADHPGLPSGWLLEQAVYTGQARRGLLGMLVLDEGWTILDAGCGFGTVPFEIAGNAVVAAHGADTDPEMVENARAIGSALEAEGFFAAGSSVEFTEGDITGLPYDDGFFDLAFSSFVFQYLADPDAAADELYRVVRPGKYVCVVDADDKLSLVHPEPSDAYARLSEAFDQLQSLRGGDRYVGRKLASYLDNAGFDIAATLLLPIAQYSIESPGDPSRRFLVERLREVRSDVIDADLMSAGDFDKCLDVYSHEATGAQFRTNSQVVVVGRKPE